MPKTIVITDPHVVPGENIELLVRFICEQQRQGNVVILAGDFFEGFLARPFYISELRSCYFLVGNHEHFWRTLLAEIYGSDRVLDYLWVHGVYVTHGQKYDPVQDSEIEIALAWAMFLIYSADPNDPALQWIYERVMQGHRTNAQIINGLRTAGIRRAMTGHSHVIHAGKDGNLDYFNPGSWRDTPCYGVIEESGAMHLEVAGL